MKQFISQKDSDLLQKLFGIYVNQEVNDFIKEKIEEWYFAMASMEMNKEHFYFHDFKIFLISIIYKMQIIVLKNDIKGLILRTDTDKLYPFLDLEIFQQECNHSAACIPFPIIVQ